MRLLRIETGPDEHEKGQAAGFIAGDRELKKSQPESRREKPLLLCSGRDLSLLGRGPLPFRPSFILMHRIRGTP
jgi:hypothetical protein